MKKQSDRRNFFKKAIAVSGTIVAGTAIAESGKMKLLTPDGKLVEVDADLVKRSPKQKTTNKDLLDWSEQIKS